jgi:hydroxyethylthiazole kinase-like uncharacterized protein yjeF
LAAITTSALSIPPDLPTLTRAQVRALDAYAIEQLGIPEVVLMENAGRALAQAILEQGTRPIRVAILCGRGNNGGDGYVLARYLAEEGIQVHLLESAAPEDLSTAAATFQRICAQLDLPRSRFASAAELAQQLQALRPQALVIDALLGTGFEGELRPSARETLHAFNDAARYWSSQRIAIDTPSGLDVDTGQFDSACFHADRTLTLAANKPAFELAASAEVTGAVRVLPIGIPKQAYDWAQSQGQ